MKYLPIAMLLALMSCSSCATAKAEQKKEEPAAAPVQEKVFKKVTEIIEGDEEKIAPRPNDSGFRHIIFTSDVNAKSVKPIIDELSEKGNFKGFILELNSKGGEVDSGFLLTKAIENAGVPVHCMVDSNAMSMTYYILQSCTTRYMTKRSVLMIHGPSQPIDLTANVNRLHEMTDDLETLQNAMVEQYVARLKITKAELNEKISRRSWFLNWEEALKIGAVDGTVKSYSEMLSIAKKWKPMSTDRLKTLPK